jgi:phage terminase small subunit
MGQLNTPIDPFANMDPEAIPIIVYKPIPEPKPKRQRTPQLNMREAKFVKAKIQGLSNTQAAIVATGTTSVNSAKTLGHRLSTSVNVQEAMRIALERRNLTADRIAGVIDDAMDANKTVAVGEGDIQTVPDHSVRLKAAGMAATYMGVTKTPADGPTNNNFIQIVANQKNQYGL